jgi:hypothetical protein
VTDRLSTRQINALRAILQRKNFSADDVARIDYHVLAHTPGLGSKSLQTISEWLSTQGLSLHNAPRTVANSSGSTRRNERLERAISLLIAHGYRIQPPETPTGTSDFADASVQSEIKERSSAQG